MSETYKDIILMAILAVAVATDVRSRRIPNALTAPALAVAVAVNASQTGLEGAWFSVVGAAVGIGVLFLPFVMGGMGGGDVKLMAVVGAFKGGAFVFSAFVCAAVAGGFIAILYLIIKGNFKSTFKRIGGRLLLANGGSMECEGGRETEKGAIPYACEIFMGTLAAYYAAPVLFPG